MKNKQCTKCKAVKSVSEFYYKNKQLKNGYRSWCKVCESAALAARRKANPEKAKAISQRYKKAHPERVRNANLKVKFGITLEDYNRMWNNQNGRCAACSEPETATWNNIVKLLAVDHNHRTGKVRALLCQRCNCALGNIGDSIERLKNLINYLESN